MKLRLQIDLRESATRSRHEHEEVVRILRDAADSVEEEGKTTTGRVSTMNFVLTDFNGLIVGRVGVTA